MFITSSLVASRFASKKYEVNALYNPLYDLPYELVHHVASYLDQTDGTCLALSGIRLWKTLAPNIARPADEEPTGVWKRLSRDIYYKNRSSGWIDGRQQIWCTSCACLHCRTAFPKDTISLPRWELKCFADRSLVVCPHASYTFQSLKALMGDYTSGHATWSGSLTDCEHCQSRTSVIVMNKPKSYTPVSEVEVKTNVPLLSVPETRNLLISDIHAAMTAVAFPICPHLLTSDMDTIELLTHGKNGMYNPAYMSMYVYADCGQCRTSFSTVRARSFTVDGESLITLHITKKLGPLKKQNDSVWRAHVRPKGE